MGKGEGRKKHYKGTVYNIIIDRYPRRGLGFIHAIACDILVPYNNETMI